jgi:hypothetical protein
MVQIEEKNFCCRDLPDEEIQRIIYSLQIRKELGYIAMISDASNIAYVQDKFMLPVQ